jgi:hypothetical protein
MFAVLESFASVGRSGQQRSLVSSLAARCGHHTGGHHGQVLTGLTGSCGSGTNREDADV